MLGSESYLGRTCPIPQHIPLPAKDSCHYCYFGLSALHCCAKPAGREAPERGCDVREQHLPQPMEVRAAGHPRNSCCTPGLWLCLYCSPCSEFPAALWVTRRRSRLRVTSGPSRKGKGAPTPLLIPKHSIAACCAVL